jgi:glycosyltransferase involved in cell wall biosynthesis
MHPMNENPKILIIMPAFNEAAVIGGAIGNLRKNGYNHILIIDDGSQDATATIAKSRGALVIRHETNQGQGAALKTGLGYARKKIDPDIIVTFDADGQHVAEDIGDMLQPLLEDSADIVLGSRFLKKSSVPLMRKLILKTGVFFTNWLSGTSLTDTHNGLRAFNRKAAGMIDIRYPGMEHASGIINEIVQKKLRYVEVPVNIIYSNYSLKKGQQNSDFMKMGLKLLKEKITKGHSL